MNYIQKHWSGAYPLTVSFWANYFLLNVAITFGAALFLVVFQKPDDIQFFFRFLLNYQIIRVGISFWQSVGVYRSAQNYIHSGRKKFWAVLASTLTVISVTSAILGVLSLASLDEAGHKALIDQLATLMAARGI